ncbi:MAG: ribosome silencing factor, partial [Betaproteobacteria bacterium]|nr:ribosome silencing factor [Betaproteobacteria bacterium]
RAVVDALEDIKGRDIVVFDTSALPTLFERVIIASGDSTRQVHALADHVRKKLKELGVQVYGFEGGADSDWVLVDLGEIVVHVMHPTVRGYYNLEEIWGVKRVRMQAAPSEAAKPAAKKKPAKRASAKPAARKRVAAPRPRKASARKSKAPARKPKASPHKGKAPAARRKAPVSQGKSPARKRRSA